jgi:hypothetical protein
VASSSCTMIYTICFTYARGINAPTDINSCYVPIMTHQPPPLAYGESPLPDFIAVPMARNRHDGWTVERQREFIRALAVVGSVDAAAKMVGMSRKSAYQLRNRPDAISFAHAWNVAISTGRARIFEYLMDRSLNGVTTFTLKLGGAIEIGHGLDRQLIAGHLKAPVPGENRFAGSRSAHKGDIR